MARPPVQFYTRAAEPAILHGGELLRGPAASIGRMTSDWVKIATVASGFEADVTRAMLEEQSIPVLIRGKQAGLFGGGFQGAVPGGIDIFVPASVASQARELIDTDEESDADG